MKSIKVTECEKSRRSFFKKGVLVGLASIFSSRSIAQATPEKKNTVRLLTHEGKLVEIEKKYLPPKKDKVVSNMDLFRWKFRRD
ncbi:MAG: hypothetical protein HKN68_10880 [Saprospiraceae bacterium]|nr:hypothetical protein [Saprospiraceae bacterium]